MSQVFLSPRVIYGWGCLSALRELPARRTAVVTDDGLLEDLGVVAQAGTSLQVGGSDWVVIGRVGHEPMLADVPPLVTALREHQPTRLLALGGGSVLDLAKAAWAFYEYPDLTWDQALAFNGLPVRPSATIKLVAVPTTSGTGSEVSRVAVLIDEATRLKRLIMSPAVVPDLAVVDPALAASMPPALTAQSALDALTHAVEAAVAAVRNEFSTALALRAIRLIVTHLSAACLTGERSAREALHLAATLAGLAATNATAGLVHAMDQVGPLFGLPHGLVCAVLLPYTLVFNLEAAAPAYAEMNAACGGPDHGGTLAQARGFVRRIFALERAAALPPSFAAAGVDRAAYGRAMAVMVDATLASRSSALSPRPPSAAEAELIFANAYEGNLPDWVLA
jgi:alcohol dehydrogenase class IV